jgi:phytoene desaturase
LQAQGWDTTIVEKRSMVGGRAYQFVEAGYTFDMGPSLITAPSLIRGVFESAGKRMEDYLDLLPLDPFYRVYFHDGTHIDYTGDRDEMVEQMRAFDPRDAANYDRFMKAVRPIYDAVITEKLGAKPFDSLRTMIEFVPTVIRLNAYLSVSRFTRRFFRDFRHHFLFSFHPLFIGGNPFRAPAIYIMIPYLEREEGVWFTRGGMYSVVRAMEKLFREQGGTIHTGHEVETIATRDGTVSHVLAGGRSFPADIVVSNADVGATYRDMLAETPRKRWTDARIERTDYTMSCFLLYLGVKNRYPRLKHHTLILGPRYKGLITDIFDRKTLSKEFSMYLHAPTVTDPDMAPPGCESLYVLVPVPNLTADIDWEVEAPAFRQRVLDFLENWGLDGLQENLEVCHTFTPLDFESKLGAFHGNAFGIEPKLSQTAFFRPHNRSEDVKNLYFVGAGTHPGAGVPGVLLSAEATAGCVADDFDVSLAPRPANVVV